MFLWLRWRSDHIVWSVNAENQVISECLEKKVFTPPASMSWCSVLKFGGLQSSEQISQTEGWTWGDYSLIWCLYSLQMLPVRRETTDLQRFMLVFPPPLLTTWSGVFIQQEAWGFNCVRKLFTVELPRIPSFYSTDSFFYLRDAQQWEETFHAGFYWWEMWIKTNEEAENSRRTNPSSQTLSISLVLFWMSFTCEAFLPPGRRHR